MSLFSAIDRALQTARTSCRLSSAFDAWKGRHNALGFFGDVDDFIDWWRDFGVPTDHISSEALKALCIEATGRGRSPTGNDEVTPSNAEEAAVLLLGVLIPKLKSWIRDAGIPATLDREDTEAEIAAGLWEAVATTTANESGTAGRLMNGARRRVRGAARREIAHERICRDLQQTTYLTPSEAGHPEDVIERALAEEILNSVEADLILSTRVRNESARKAAWRHRLTPKAAEHRLVRAETRLLAWMNGGAVPTRFAAAARRPFLTPPVRSGVLGLREAARANRQSEMGEEVISVSRAGEPRRPGAIIRPARGTAADHGSC